MCIDLEVQGMSMCSISASPRNALEIGVLGRERMPCGALGLGRDGATTAHHRIVDEPPRPLTHHRPKRAPSKLLCKWTLTCPRCSLNC